MAPPPILLVEDDYEVREALRAVLQSHGFDVTSAPDGVEALRILWRGLRPGVILLDLMLPHVVGALSFHEFLRANRLWAGIPIVVVSGLSEMSDPLESLQPVAWFNKPVDLDALTATLRALLVSRQSAAATRWASAAWRHPAPRSRQLASTRRRLPFGGTSARRLPSPPGRHPRPPS
jgi:DNA-binding response OmpR family regulator